MPDVRKYKVLIAAIGISLGWHLFCMSAVRVVASPIPAKGIKFGKVSFLGAMGPKSGMEFKLSPRQRSFLEKRYLSRLDALASGRKIPLSAGYAGYEPESQAENGITGLISNAVAAPKAEPDDVI